LFNGVPLPAVGGNSWMRHLISKVRKEKIILFKWYVMEIKQKYQKINTIIYDLLFFMVFGFFSSWTDESICLSEFCVYKKTIEKEKT